jgi:hypothetical protein
VDVTLRNVSQHTVSLIALDPVVITDDQKEQPGVNHTTVMKVGYFGLTKASAKRILANGTGVDPDVAMTINFTLFGASKPPVLPESKSAAFLLTISIIQGAISAAVWRR